MSFKITLYSQAASSACERVRIALAYKSIAHDTIIINDLPPGEYARINPQGLMPAMAIDGRVISQSMAMLEFLEEICPEPSLLPGDPITRAQVRAFVQIVASDIHPVGINRLRKKMRDDFGVSEDLTMVWYDDMAQGGFSVLEGILERTRGEGPYCFGQDLTLADVVMVPHMHTARSRGVDFSAFPLVMSVFEHCIAHPAFVKAARENQADA